MKEYIEKNKLYKMVAEKEETARKWTLDTPTNSPAYMRYVAQLNERTAFKHMVADIPAADVVEVRHGRWSMTKDGAAYCSACKRKMNPYLYGYAHCAMCGARMDGGVNDGKVD